ncbi:helix-turn-helix domain-containing protein [Pedococcus soli]
MDEFDGVGYLLRARRRAQLSQREMAGSIGVAQATLSAYEGGRRKLPEPVLVAALRVAGLRLVVVDEKGQEVTPFPADAVRDNAGRRFPAHLEVQPPDQLPSEALRAARPVDRRREEAQRPSRGGRRARGSCSGGANRRRLGCTSARW